MQEPQETKFDCGLTRKQWLFIDDFYKAHAKNPVEYAQAIQQLGVAEQLLAIEHATTPDNAQEQFRAYWEIIRKVNMRALKIITSQNRNNLKPSANKASRVK